ncbi:DUF5011 domain-containing protein [bacterium]|nr:DUF5011 domain-containing protein [bacterium]
MMTINIQKTLLPAIAVIFLTACGGGGSSTPTNTEGQSITKIEGQIIDAPIANLIYTCGGETLRTNNNGEFSCSTFPITFSLGNIELGTLATPTSDSKVYLQDLLSLDRSNFDDEALIRMAILIQSMDSNRVPTIDIPDDAHTAFTTTVKLSDLTSMSEIEALITQVGKTAITRDEAIAHLKEFSSVSIPDTQVPVVTITGTIADIALGGTYTELGATVTDNVDTGLATVITGSVDTTKVGEYTLTYTATDSAGNIGTATRVVRVIDPQAPVVTLVGVTADIPLGEIYTELGATITDNVDTGLAAVITGSVNTSVVGEYTLTYTATDSAGNVGTATRVVKVIDPQAPVVILVGVTADIPLDGTYTELGATVTDNVDTNLTVLITGSVDTTKVGEYTLTYTATDSTGNVGTATRVVKVIDVTSPVVTVTGVTADVSVGGTYTELGATVTDNVDTGLAAIVTGSVDTTKVGEYTLTYTATDSAGNVGTATRVVKVVDRGVPVVTITDVTADIEVGGSYSELGATVTDNVDTGLQAIITGNVDTATVGEYTLTYTATDSAGNVGTATRVVNVVDTTKPVITLDGDAVVTVTEGTTYTDAGARANDNYDGDISSNINTTNPVDATTIGNYTVTYNVQDAANNAATPVTRTVNVVADTIAPSITLLGNTVVYLEKDTTYTDAGASANDNKDGDISANIITTGAVDTSTVGSYVITYNVQDAANNAATPVTRKVNIIPTIIAPFKTGQLASYDAAGNDVNDGSVKDDGYYKKGVSRNFTRDDATEIVTDNVTGLMWQDNDDVTAFLRTYGDSPYYCSVQELGGYEDWRMPTISELESIIDYKGSYRNIDGIAYLPLIDAAFTKKVEERYWSSTPYVGSEDVWIVHSYTGVVDASSTDSSVQNYTRCVRNAR